MASNSVFTIFFTVILFSILLMNFGICSDIDCPQPAVLDKNQAQALRSAARDLGKHDWSCTDEPCTNGNPETCWYKNQTDNNSIYDNRVECGCLDKQWHVTSILWKGQDLNGSLPSSLANLTYLQKLDLARNLISGSIPEEWASMKKLTYLSFQINKLSGQIPRYLGNFTFLTYISFQSNHLSGDIPVELGKLVMLQYLFLDDNYLTGSFPDDLKKLSNLTELQLSSNNFHGRLPDFFGSWRNLQKLTMLGSGFEGPIPPSLSLLSDVSILRISDLSGEGSKFPSLQNLTNLTSLVLRNCNISGQIPHYLTKVNWKILDLSFNKLEGSIPTFGYVKEMYLSHNMLTGTIPSWIKNNPGSPIDLSYNLLNDSCVSSGNDYSTDTINLYRSFSSDRNLAQTPCLQNNYCPKARYSLYVNCGGEKISGYEKDDTSGGAARLFHSETGWGFSSSGGYWQTVNIGSSYIKKNNSSMSIEDYKSYPDALNPSVEDYKLYADARFSATYLTYYGLCFQKGNYTVKLNFIEMFFSDNNSSFYSLGRRKFDIYIQEKLVWKDFDIVANGHYRPVELVFNHIQVNGTIEIRLYYAGKGSVNIPINDQGAYGPLISAISVEPEFKTPLYWKKVRWISIGAASLLLSLVGVILAFFWWKRGLDGTSREQDLLGLDLQTGLFTFRQIRAATNNFDPARKIGEGGFGSVFLGTLLDGTRIAVKQLSSKSSEGNREFVNEIGIISSLRHPNLVKLFGCCVEGNQLFLIYEYMENNNLALALFGASDGQLRLDWPTRLKICFDVARGLTYLHEESSIKIVHRDIKATNILLGRDLNAKIADFGLARLHEEQNTHISTRVAGTIGYMAPEYALWGYLTYKADVFSFGVVLLEIVAGRSNMKQPDEKHFCLLDKAFVLHHQKQNIIELVDQRLGTEYNEDEALTMIKIALSCTNPSPALRPTMSEVLCMLEGSLVVPQLHLDTNVHSSEWMYQAFRMPQHDQMNEKETHSLILDYGAPEVASSSSNHNLYPFIPLSR